MDTIVPFSTVLRIDYKNKVAAGLFKYLEDQGIPIFLLFHNAKRTPGCASLAS